MTSVLALSGRQVQTSVAGLLERQWRLNHWLVEQLLGCGKTCEMASQPTNHYDIYVDGNGNVETSFIDLSSVPEDNGVKELTINLEVASCTNGCSGANANQNLRIAVSTCGCCDPSDELVPEVPVTVKLTNNNVAVTQDAFGNPVPSSYLVGCGQIKYIVIANGSISRLVD